MAQVDAEMSRTMSQLSGARAHDHVFLGEAHGRNERRTWIVIAVCSAMMVVETVGGYLFGSIALIADGLHMSTHAGAMLLAALAYRYASRHARDPRFSFGTGKLGDLAGFTSAIVLAMVALLIGYESITRLFAPEPIRFGEAIPLAVLGLGVNAVSAWLLGGGHHHGHEHERHEHDQAHGHHHRDNNMRAALVHVLADAAVSVVVIAGLILARLFGWLWMDPVAGLVGSAVIATWSWGLMRDTGAILLDMVPDAALAERLRREVEAQGDQVADLHLWRLGPGHLGAIVSIDAGGERDVGFYRERLGRLPSLSHLTVEVIRAG